MRISTKGRYALRLMLDIAMNDAEGKPVRVKDIAKRHIDNCPFPVIGVPLPKRKGSRSIFASTLRFL